MLTLSAWSGLVIEYRTPACAARLTTIDGLYCSKMDSTRDLSAMEPLINTSSSVYGTNKKVPYSIEDKVDNPVSLYAATKKYCSKMDSTRDLSAMEPLINIHVESDEQTLL